MPPDDAASFSGLLTMSRRSEQRTPKLIEDGRGYRTPLEQTDVAALARKSSSGRKCSGRRSAAAPPPIPRYDTKPLRKLHERSPAPEMPGPKSLVVAWMQ